MNIYLLLEGEKTEFELYPAWLSYLLPELHPINSLQKKSKNSYYLRCGFGIPDIYNHTVNAIKDINKYQSFDYLIVCLDAEEMNEEGRRNKFLLKIREREIKLNPNCHLKIIVQNKCIETWLLGNRKVYKQNPEGELFRKFAKLYNVSKNDPELMSKIDNFRTTARFHEIYLKEMLKEYNMFYRKVTPRIVSGKPYFEELVTRIESSSHLKSFAYFISLCKEIKSKI